MSMPYLREQHQRTFERLMFEMFDDFQINVIGRLLGTVELKTGIIPMVEKIGEYVVSRGSKRPNSSIYSGKLPIKDGNSPTNKYISLFWSQLTNDKPKKGQESLRIVAPINDQTPGFVIKHSHDGKPIKFKEFFANMEAPVDLIENGQLTEIGKAYGPLLVMKSYKNCLELVKVSIS